MKEILNFTYEIGELDGEKRRLVNARDLHKQLEIPTRFNDWVKRYLIKQGFTQGVDYITKSFDYSKVNNQTGRGGDRKSITYLVTIEVAEHLAMMAKIPHSRSHGVREKAALDTIEQLLGIKLKRQYSVLGGRYRIDGYDLVNNVAYEVDEEQHFTPQHIGLDRIREEEIFQELGCRFVRIKV